jgi:hypothetical protein
MMEIVLERILRGAGILILALMVSYGVGGLVHKKFGDIALPPRMGDSKASYALSRILGGLVYIGLLVLLIEVLYYIGLVYE